MSRVTQLKKWLTFHILCWLCEEAREQQKICPGKSLDMQEGDGISTSWTEHRQTAFQTTEDPGLDTLLPLLYQRLHPGTINPPPSTGPPGARVPQGTGSFISTTVSLAYLGSQKTLVAVWDKT